MDELIGQVNHEGGQWQVRGAAHGGRTSYRWLLAEWPLVGHNHAHAELIRKLAEELGARVDGPMRVEHDGWEWWRVVIYPPPGEE